MIILICILTVLAWPIVIRRSTLNVLTLINHPLFWLVLGALVVFVEGCESIEAASLYPRKFSIVITTIATIFLVGALWGFIFSTHWGWLEAMASWTFF
ncbi:MAG: hypothetical protein KA604_04280 [Candidatus Saccharimonas sp.]|nr:hypothetical protein [Candidatus Saccharimonas sp.]